MPHYILRKNYNLSFFRETYHLIYNKDERVFIYTYLSDFFHLIFIGEERNGLMGEEEIKCCIWRNSNGVYRPQMDGMYPELKVDTFLVEFISILVCTKYLILLIFLSLDKAFVCKIDNFKSNYPNYGQTVCFR